MDSLLCPFSLSPAASSSISSRRRLSIVNPTKVGLDSGLGSTTSTSSRLPRQFSSLKVRAVVAENEKQNWWEKNAPTMVDVHSTQEFVHELSQAGDKLVIVEFYATWCASCRALFPKLCKVAEEHPEIVVVKVNFDENKAMCKRLNVRVLPYFHFYRGADGLLEAFSCNLSKLQKLKDAITTHNSDRCSIGPPVSIAELDLLQTLSQETPKEASTR